MPPRLIALAALSISVIAMPAGAATLIMPGIHRTPAPAVAAATATGRPASPDPMATDANSGQPQNASQAPAPQLGETGAHNEPSHLPEPASWVLIMAGFGLLGSAMRRQGRARSHIQFG